VAGGRRLRERKTSRVTTTSEKGKNGKRYTSRNEIIGSTESQCKF